ncbi:MAG: MoxR family ATPase [Xanthomonadales bacterium]|nr:MoxR family ATPase [Xanthomonadales bacterium]
MAVTSEQALLSPQHAALREAQQQVNQVVLGKDQQVELAFATLLAGGHLLIEDLPGVGKTTLAHALALTLGLDYNRIQFTSDLLPADVLGVSIYHNAENRFDFHPGPVFSQVVLADELNRATPKTQSSLLEAMAEGQISIDGNTRALPQPFFVIATQNPLDLVGTYPLPDSQLDRFLLNISLGYPSREAERRLLQEDTRANLLIELKPVLNAQSLGELKAAVRKVHTSDALLDYIQDLVAATREHPKFVAGLSPRATLALIAVSRALAFLRGREYVIPEDIKTVFPPLARHRLQVRSTEGDRNSDRLIQVLLEEVAIP